jgi:ABC-2 type transport system ATP-binding protein
VADLTLAVQPGEVFGLLGANGAGKTTAVKMLLSLIQPTSGSARLLGRPLGDVAARSRLGFLPERCTFQTWLTGREFLWFHGRLLSLPKRTLGARIEALLARLDLHAAAGRSLSEYSQGMRQRIGLAQALLNDPELVFLDEPTSALDPLGRILVRDLVAELRARGCAVFLNSHLLSEVEVTCDRVAFLRDGRIVREMALAQSGSELLLQLHVAPVKPELLRGLERFGRRVRHDGEAIELEVSGEAQIPELVRWLVEQGVAVGRVATRRRSLEAAFLEVMGSEARPT